MRTLTTWQDGAIDAVQEMIARDARPKTLAELRDAYDGFFGPAQQPLEAERAAAAWSEFGARCWASAVTVADSPLLWQTVIDTVIRKQHDYGKENILRFGQLGLEVRVHDKLARLEHLTATREAPKVADETLADTVLDLVGYSVLGIMVARGSFDLPFA